MSIVTMDFPKPLGQADPSTACLHRNQHRAELVFAAGRAHGCSLSIGKIAPINITCTISIEFYNSIDKYRYIMIYNDV